MDFRTIGHMLKLISSKVINSERNDYDGYEYATQGHKLIVCIEKYEVGDLHSSI